MNFEARPARDARLSSNSTESEALCRAFDTRNRLIPESNSVPECVE
jgi:hypothetical protein